MGAWHDPTRRRWPARWSGYPSFMKTVISVEIVIGVAIAVVLLVREI
jgi:hypothetical protein